MDTILMAWLRKTCVLFSTDPISHIGAHVSDRDIHFHCAEGRLDGTDGAGSTVL